MASYSYIEEATGKMIVCRLFILTWNPELKEEETKGSLVKNNAVGFGTVQKKCMCPDFPEVEIVFLLILSSGSHEPLKSFKECFGAKAFCYSVNEDLSLTDQSVTSKQILKWFWGSSIWIL